MVEIAPTAGVVVRLADVVPVREIPDHHHIVNIMLRIQSFRIIKKYYFVEQNLLTCKELFHEINRKA